MGSTIAEHRRRRQPLAETSDAVEGGLLPALVERGRGLRLEIDDRGGARRGSWRGP